MTENSDKLDNMTVRRFAKLIKGNGSNNGSTGITTGTVIQNDNQLYVAVDDETLVPVADTASNVNVGDKVTLAIDNEEALIVGNNSDASPTASELSETDTKATFAKVDASEAKDTAQTAQVTANTAQNTAETAQTTADNAQSTAQTAKETADAVDGKATEAKETATQAQATATTASETATQAQTTANTAKETADTASTKADNAQSTADTASSKADNAQSTADTASSKADTAQNTAETAQTTADNAQSTATEAQSTAQTAKETADAVDGKATEAKETATQAQATATTASETATQAQTTANTAKETADTASTKADNAQSTADTASSKADNAQSTADTASSKADTAQNTAETAQTTADNAQSTATEAQSTAQTAKETADAVDGKATEAQSTANTAQTTANTAKETADTASTKADNAQSTADTAQTTAETAQARAEGAEKVATDFIDIDDNKGITVGDMTAGTLGKNTYINKDGISIRDGETALASFNKNQISLGQNSFDSKIQFNSGLSTISANKYGTTQWDTKGLELNANNSDIVLHGRSDTGGAGFQLGERSISCGRWESSLYTDLIPLEISVFDNIIYLGKLLSETSARTGVEIEFKDDGTISLEAPKLIQDGKQVSVVGHNHASDALTPATINTTSSIKQNGTQVSLEGHTHEAKDLTTSTPILKVVTSSSSSVTASKQSSFVLSCPVPTVTGYTLIGCVGWNTNSSSTLMRRSVLNGSNWDLLMYNISTSSITVTGNVKLLFAKEGWV